MNYLFSYQAMTLFFNNLMSNVYILLSNGNVTNVESKLAWPAYKIFVLHRSIYTQELNVHTISRALAENWWITTAINMSWSVYSGGRVFPAIVIKLEKKTIWKIQIIVKWNVLQQQVTWFWLRMADLWLYDNSWNTIEN